MSKERAIEELYRVTKEINEPEITPILKGSVRMQGPMDECELSIEKNTGPSRAGKRYNPVKGKYGVKAKSGTCNVCAAPCSSCMHFKRAGSCRGVKAEVEFSNEISRSKDHKQHSSHEAKQPSSKNRACTDQHSVANETSNLVSPSSSHDSFSENAESKSSMFPTVLVGGAIGHKEQKLVECDGDNISCVSAVDQSISPVGDHNVDVDRKNVSCSTASVNSVSPEGPEKIVLQSAPDCLTGSHSENVDHIHKHSQIEMNSKHSNMKDHDMNSENVDLLQKSDPMGICSPKDLSVVNGSDNVLNLSSHSRSARSTLCNADSRGLLGNSFTRDQVEPFEYSGKEVESSIAKVATSISREKLDLHIKDEIRKSSPVRSSCETPIRIYPCLEAGVDAETGNSPAEPVKSLDLKGQIDKSIPLPRAQSAEDTPLEPQPVNENDGSDIVEDDVKVCDICGDAGREDLLATCSRCNDGAEHTYCMRIRMEKVPNSDWLCEECQLIEDASKEKQDKLDTVSGISKVSSGNENGEPPGPALSTKTTPKMNTKLTDGEANLSTKVVPSMTISSKRHADDLEVTPTAKRQAVESSFGSPKPFSPSKKGTLSRESSFKNFDKGKVKTTNLVASSCPSANISHDIVPSSIISAPNSSRIQKLIQSPRGTLLKSSSFSSLSRPKVKPIQDVPHKHKLSKHLSMSGAKKDGLLRTLKKSHSFKPGCIQSSSTESKAKLPSSNFSHAEDLRVLRSKERNSTERKDHLATPIAITEQKVASRGDNTSSMLSSATNNRDVLAAPIHHHAEDLRVLRSKERNSTERKDHLATPIAITEQKVTSRGDNTSSMLSSATNNRDGKVVQLNISSKQTNAPSPKGTETPNSSGRADMKRHPSLLSRGTGHSTLNGSSTEKKANQVGSKDIPSCTADRQLCGNNSDVPQSRESSIQDKKASEPKQCVQSGVRSIRCQKCKEVGHAKQFCPNASLVSLETSGARIPKDAMDGSTISKDGVEAPISKRSKTGNKSGLPDQSGKLYTSSTGLSSAVASKDQVSTPLSCSRNMIYSDGVHDGQESFMNFTTDSCKTATITETKSRTLFMKEPTWTLNGEKSDEIVPSDEICLRSSSNDFPNPASSVSTFSENSSHPEQEIIWKGCFEVQKDGTLMDLYDGIEAHLSVCASPKVPEVVNKFPHRVLLQEVSRLSTWPAQFQNNVTEDNIALYFFANNDKSHAGKYKILMENMIKNDLALKGSIDGIELLIFPSNQFCPDSQRWNMMFFLWGVFRGKRASCSDRISVSRENLVGADLNVTPLEEESGTAIMTVAQQECSSGNLDVGPSDCGRLSEAHEAVKSSMSIQLPSFSSSGRVDTNCDKEEFSSGSKCSALETKTSPNHNVCNSDYGFGIPSKTQFFSETEGNNTPMVEHRNLKSTEEASRGKMKDTSMINAEALSGLAQRLPWEVREHNMSNMAPHLYNVEGSSDSFLSQVHEKRLDRAYDDAILPSSSRNSEIHFFPMDLLGPTKDSRSGTNAIPVQILSSDDEDQLDLGVPDLELALGAKEKSTKQGELPLFTILAGKHKNMKLADPMEENAEDDLSLSLSVPFAEKTMTANNVSKPTVSSHSTSQSNTPRFFFGKCSGS